MLRNILLLTYPKLLFRYDSVIFNGQVRWQDRLNSYNLPFFLPSTGFFTNYTVSTGLKVGCVDTQRR
jgi:endo-beta-N-acetylglucosaminidase D